MFRKIIIYVTLVCFIICIQGCTSKYAIPTEELQQEPEWGNVTIKTIDGEFYEFDSVYVSGDYIEGYVDDSTLVSILLEDVESVRVLRYNPARTVVLMLGISAVVGLAFLTWYAVALGQAMGRNW